MTAQPQLSDNVAAEVAALRASAAAIVRMAKTEDLHIIARMFAVSDAAIRAILQEAKASP